MKHTQGPWEACCDGDCSCGQVWSKTADHPVATVISGEWGDSPKLAYGSVNPEAAKANARLIAAAPGLYEALKEALPWLKRDAHREITQRAEAAIAQAEGRL